MNTIMKLLETLNPKKNRKYYFRDYSGEQFGRLTVLERVYKDESSKKLHWKCLCQCGNIRVMVASAFVSGKVVSCGCYNLEKIRLRKARLSHNLSRSRQYGIWRNIISRCDNKNLNCYKDYGGRGITYDPRWKSFEEFWKDMSESYSDALQIDRIDNNGNYTKNNCRWTTSLTNVNNRRNTLIIPYNGGNYYIKDLSKLLNKKTGTIYAYYKRNGFINQ